MAKTDSKASKKAAVESSSSSDSSSSDSEVEVKSKKTQQAPAKAAPKKAPVESSDSSDSDSDSDSSSSDSDAKKKPAAKKAASPVVAPKKAPAAPAAASKKKAADSSDSDSDSGSDSSSSSSDSDSDSDSDKKPAATNNKRKAEADEQPAKKLKTNSGEAKPAEASGGEPVEVFCGGLSYDVTEENLREVFAGCGEILDVRLPTDRETGRPRGIAFVKFSNKAGAEKAAEKDGTELLGRWMKVNIAEGRKEREPAGNREPTQKPEGCTTVFVGNLSFEASEDDLYQVFGECGTVTNVRIATDRETGRMKGFAHVEFDSTEATDKAVKMAGTDLGGRPLRVDYAGGRDGAGGGGGGGRGGGFGGGRGGGRGGGFGGGRGGGFGGGRGGGFGGGRGGGFGGGRGGGFGGGRGGGRGGFGAAKTGMGAPEGRRTTFDD